MLSSLGSLSSRINTVIYLTDHAFIYSFGDGLLKPLLRLGPWRHRLYKRDCRHQLLTATGDGRACDPGDLADKHVIINREMPWRHSLSSGGDRLQPTLLGTHRGPNPTPLHQGTQGSRGHSSTDPWRMGGSPAQGVFLEKLCVGR